MRFVAFLAACLAFAAHAASPFAVFQGQHVKGFLFEQDCERPDMAAVLAQFSTDAKRAMVVFQGMDLQACYIRQGDRVIVIDEMGDAGFIEVKNFKPVPTV